MMVRIDYEPTEHRTNKKQQSNKQQTERCTDYNKAMNKLPPSVRKSLIEKAAARFNGSSNSTKEWCLQSLSTINKRYGADNMKPNRDVADVLLSEANVRLASQHKKCMDMISQLEVSGDVTKSESPQAVKSQSGTTNTATPKGIIRAVNNPVQHDMRSFRDWMQKQRLWEEGKEKALKILKDLEILHADTFALTDHLLSNGKPTLQRFSKADENLIAATFEQIRSRHASTVENMADIVINIRDLPNMAPLDLNYNSNLDHSGGVGVTTIIDDALVDSFLKERLGIQLLCDHYVALDKGKPGGGIAVDCPLNDVVTDASIEAKHICDANYGIAPEVHVHRIYSEGVGDKDEDEPVHVTLVRPWVHHALVELLKNAMRSSIQKGGSSFPPDVHVVIRNVEANDEDYVVCEVIDQGVGLSELNNSMAGLEGEGWEEVAFGFATSSSQQRWDRLDEQQSYAMVRAPIASLGVGLTLSRMMMNMFGGNIYLSTNSLRRDIIHAESLEHLRLDSQCGCTATLYLPSCDKIKEWDTSALPYNINVS